MNKEIRIHGRGGQGVVAMAEILAIAFFNNGKNSQAFPNFGVERSGAPIQSFVRISDEEISIREHIYEPDILIILDFSLIGRADLFSGLKKNSIIIINSELEADKIFQEINKKYKLVNGFKSSQIYSFPASKIAIDIFGKNMVNTVMLGALCNLPDLLDIDSAINAVKIKFSEKGSEIVNKNILAIKKINNLK